MSERLNKFLATNMGVSRRVADDLISDGKVSVGGSSAVLGARVEQGDVVKVDGKVIGIAPLVYLAFHKPVGYVSSRRAQGVSPTLYELLPDKYRDLKTVGRLDKDSSGLILLTNDGDFAFSMTHPQFAKVKVYEVLLDRDLSPLHQQMISDFGVDLPDGSSKMALTRMDGARKSWRVEISEGRNRQIRRTFGALGYSVVGLHRISFGVYRLGGLEVGQFEELAV